MNQGVTADIEENTLTLTNGKGETQSFEVKGKTTRKLNVESRGETTFRYDFPNGVTVSVTTPGETRGPYSILVSKDKTKVYEGRLASKADADRLIIALQKIAEQEIPGDPTALEGGKNRKKTIRRKRVSRKKPAKLSRRRKFTHSK
jgi:hypothetical protein